MLLEEMMFELELLDQLMLVEELMLILDNIDLVMMNVDVQVGGDNFGIQFGSGGGLFGVGCGGVGNVIYGCYFGYLMQQVILCDDKVKCLVFQLQVNVWLVSDGCLEKVELVCGSGNEEVDVVVFDVLCCIGKVDQVLLLLFDFFVCVLIQGCWFGV